MKGVWDMNVIRVGERYPGAIPPQDGFILEIGPDGDLVLMIRMDRPTDQESAALQAGYDRYALFEAAGTPVLAAFVFKYPAPVGYAEAPFHAGLYPDGRARKFLDHEGNILQTYVLDGGIVKIARISGLQDTSVATFRGIIKRQLEEGITPVGYQTAVDRLYRMTSEQIFRAGHQYRHQEVK